MERVQRLIVKVSAFHRILCSQDKGEGNLDYCFERTPSRLKSNQKAMVEYARPLQKLRFQLHLLQCLIL